MKKEEFKSYMEVFICNHKDCLDRGSKHLTDKLKKWAKEETHKEIRVFRSGCLGKCDDGIALACFPQKKFLVEVEEDDYKELRDLLQMELDQIKSAQS